ncbi:MAG: hypothetical protein O4859_12855 [Trichodesmium sp. St18_bin1]|nr:hypothetical protein [Trichodesmium sp. St18_bin1]MDE5119953.1 hypothetical protein [Trichodesmium sp. St19_bin1]
MSTVLPSHCYERYFLVWPGIAGLDVSVKLDLSIRQWECRTLWD